MNTIFKLTLVVVLSILCLSAEAKNIKLVYHNQNPENEIWVYDQGNKRCLSFEKPYRGTYIEQTCYNKTNPDLLSLSYTKVQVSSIIMSPNPKKILLLGLGGASIAKAINFLHPEAHFDIVEINKDLVDVSKQYFGFSPNENTKIHIEDGIKFLQQSPEETYDIVILDIFGKDYIPPEVLKKSFVQNVYRVLKKNGVVTANTFASSKVKELETSLFKEEFGDILNIKINRSRLITAVKGKLPSNEEIIQNSLIWKEKLDQLGVNYQKMLKLYSIRLP